MASLQLIQIAKKGRFFSALYKMINITKAIIQLLQPIIKYIAL